MSGIVVCEGSEDSFVEDPVDPTVVVSLASDVVVSSRPGSEVEEEAEEVIKEVSSLFLHPLMHKEERTIVAARDMAMDEWNFFIIVFLSGLVMKMC